MKERETAHNTVIVSGVVRQLPKGAADWTMYKFTDAKIEEKLMLWQTSIYRDYFNHQDKIEGSQDEQIKDMFDSVKPFQDHQRGVLDTRFLIEQDTNKWLLLYFEVEGTILHLYIYSRTRRRVTLYIKTDLSVAIPNESTLKVDTKLLEVNYEPLIKGYNASFDFAHLAQQAVCTVVGVLKARQYLSPTNPYAFKNEVKKTQVKLSKKEQRLNKSKIGYKMVESSYCSVTIKHRDVLELCAMSDAVLNKLTSE